MLFPILNVTILYFEHKQTRENRERMQMHFYRGSVFRLRNPHSHWRRHRSRRDEHTETWNCSLETSRFCWREHPVCSIPCSLCYLETQSGQWDECFTRSVTRKLTPSEVRTGKRLHMLILLQIFSSDASAQSMIWLHQNDEGIQEPSAQRRSEDKHEESGTTVENVDALHYP